MSKKFQFNFDNLKTKTKEESSLFNPNAAVRHEEPAIVRPNYQKPAPASGQKPRGGSTSSVGSSNATMPQKHLATKSGRTHMSNQATRPASSKTTAKFDPGPAKKRRIENDSEDDESVASSSSKFTTFVVKTTTSKGKPINITADPYSSKDNDKLKGEEKYLFERLKNQKKLISETLIRGHEKEKEAKKQQIDDNEELEFERYLKEIYGKKLNKAQKNSKADKFSFMYKKSSELLTEHFSFLHEVEKHICQTEGYVSPPPPTPAKAKLSSTDDKPKKRGRKPTTTKNQDAPTSKQVSKPTNKVLPMPARIDEEIDQELVHRIENSTVTFPPDTIQPMEKLIQLAKDQGLILLNAWQYPLEEVVRRSKQFDENATCMWCKAHGNEVKKPHDSCPYKTCPCVECLKYDAKDAVMNFLDGPDPDPWEPTKAEADELAKLFAMMPPSPTKPPQVFVLPENNRPRSNQGSNGLPPKSPVLSML